MTQYQRNSGSSLHCLFAICNIPFYCRYLQTRDASFCYTVLGKHRFAVVSMKNSLFLCYYSLIIIVFLIRTTVNLLLLNLVFPELQGLRSSQEAQFILTINSLENFNTIKSTIKFQQDLRKYSKAHNGLGLCIVYSAWVRF